MRTWVAMFVQTRREDPPDSGMLGFSTTLRESVGKYKRYARRDAHYRSFCIHEPDVAEEMMDWLLSLGVSRKDSFGVLRELAVGLREIQQLQDDDIRASD
jgi:hypothetical protein